MNILPIHGGSCHCGSVRFEVLLPDGLFEPGRCNCSMCRRRGASMATVPRDAFQLTEGEEYLSLYQFTTRTAKHYFCKKCGIYTHHQKRSNPTQYGINIACLDGV